MKIYCPNCGRLMKLGKLEHEEHFVAVCQRCGLGFHIYAMDAEEVQDILRGELPWEKIIDRLTEKERLVFDCLTRGKGKTFPQLLEETKLSPEELDRILRRLGRLGIVRAGSLRELDYDTSCYFLGEGWKIERAV
jgi:hypothetical protein